MDEILDRDIERLRQAHAEKKRRPRLLADRISQLKPIRAHFGALAPETIAPAYIADYRRKRAGDGVGARTISLELAYLRAALRAAKRDGVISAVPDIVLPQSKAKARYRALTRKELTRLMAALNDPTQTPLHLKGFVMLSLHTGQRGVHIKALRWEHVDLDDGMIYFTLSNPHAAENKQCADMPITRGLRPVLQEMRVVARTPYVIEWEDAPVVSFKRSWAGLTARAKLADLHIHDLRRSFATLGAIADIPIEQIANLLNVDAETLRRHYAHGLSDQTRKLIERIGGEGE